MRFCVENFGCRVNQAEASYWIESLQNKGWEWSKNPAKSDVIIINTCTLTSKADREVRKLIRKVNRINPQAKILLTGCYAERARDCFKKAPEVWCVLENKEKEKLPAILIEKFNKNENLKSSNKKLKLYRARAFVKIQDGCNFNCSFCIIPSVRGKSQSKKPSIVRKEIEKYLKHGFREIVLCGIHLCSYGMDLLPKSSLRELLKGIEDINMPKIIRLSSLDPRFLEPSLISYLTSSPIIAPHFHFSFQSGSKKILEKMFRNSTPEQYMEILNSFFKSIPEASLGTDIIIGFPEETEKEFNETYRFLANSPLTYFHVFPFSPRPGTPAYSWSQINGKIKKERAKTLRKLSLLKNFNFRKKFINKNLKGIVIKTNKNFAEFLTYNYIKVNIPIEDNLKVGEEKEVKILRVTPSYTEGKILL